ncbi:hypothetical protein HX744_27450 [Pseudonocardia sp. ICBG1122]|nr:hypothetical protein [Pseudonocardia pini]
MVASLLSVALLGMISPEVPRYPLAPDAPPRPAFLVGPAVQHTATEDRELYLIVNDNVDFHHDDTGSFTVTVDVRSPGIPARADLERGHEYTSPSGACALRFQDDGNLVLSRRPDGTPVWALQQVLGDRWSGHSRVEFDGDGHLVVHDASGAPVWTSPVPPVPRRSCPSPTTAGWSSPTTERRSCRVAGREDGGGRPHGA